MTVKHDIPVTSIVPPANEKEWLKEILQKNVLIYDTGALMKFERHETMWNLFDMDKRKNGGLNFYMMHGGKADVIPGKTPEMHGTTKDNAYEKAQRQYYKYVSPAKDDPQGRTVLEVIQDDILRKPGGESVKQEFDPHKVQYAGATEDSKWFLEFANEHQRKTFMDKMLTRITELIPSQNHWLLENLRKHTEFPGTDLKPITEALGGFDNLMDHIYKVAEDLKIEELRYVSATTTTFVSFRTGKMLQKTFEGRGRLMNREEYETCKAGIHGGEAFFSDHFMLPDGQRDDNNRKSVQELMETGLLVTPAKKLPADYERRKLTEWLCDEVGIGKRQRSKPAGKWNVPVAYTSADWFRAETAEKKPHWVPKVHDQRIVEFPRQQDLLRYPTMSQMGMAGIVVVHHSGATEEEIRKTNFDPDLSFLLNLYVNMETEGRSMDRKIILDNTTGRFDKSLEILTDASLKGRTLGPLPFIIAHSQEELRELADKKYTELLANPQPTRQDFEAALEAYRQDYERLRYASLTTEIEKQKDVIQRMPQLKSEFTEQPKRKEAAMPKSFPDDGIPTLLVCGGHSNNNASDLEQAFDFGYQCAQQGWRIVTGGGIVEGSMGATHTGFVQYHLDRMLKKESLADTANGFGSLQKEKLVELRSKLSAYLSGPPNNRSYDAEKIIKKEPELINELADLGLIPRDMFWAYSTKDLLELEGSGEETPGVTYHSTGTRFRRLDRILGTGTKIFLPGSLGTDEEMLEAISQHNQIHNTPNCVKQYFRDGTPNEEGRIIIYNDGRWNALLEHLHILAPAAELEKLPDEEAKDALKAEYRDKAEAKGIFIAENNEQLKEMRNTRKSWLDGHFAQREKASDGAKRA